MKFSSTIAFCLNSCQNVIPGKEFNKFMKFWMILTAQTIEDDIASIFI